MLTLWIDDIRDPTKSLSNDQLENLVWKNEAWSARKYLFEEAEQEIEILYLDNFLGDRRITGEMILEKLAYRVSKPGAFPKLKTIYLHTSDDMILERCIEKNFEKFKKYNIALLKANYHR